MIETREISKSFADKQVLDKVSVSFEQGQTNLVIGQSGSGKTVLIKCLVGLYDADEVLSRPRIWKGEYETLTVGLAKDLAISLPRGAYDDLDATMM